MFLYDGDEMPLWSNSVYLIARKMKTKSCSDMIQLIWYCYDLLSKTIPIRIKNIWDEIKKVVHAAGFSNNDEHLVVVKRILEYFLYKSNGSQ